MLSLVDGLWIFLENVGSLYEKFLMLVFFDSGTSIEFFVCVKKIEKVLTLDEAWLLILFWLFLRLRFSLSLSIYALLNLRLFLGFLIRIVLFSGVY